MKALSLVAARCRRSCGSLLPSSLGSRQRHLDPHFDADAGELAGDDLQLSPELGLVVDDDGHAPLIAIAGLGQELLRATHIAHVRIRDLVRVADKSLRNAMFVATACP